MTGRYPPPEPVSALGLENLLTSSHGFTYGWTTGSPNDKGGRVLNLGAGTYAGLRVVIYADDGPRVDLYGVDKWNDVTWRIRFGPGTPGAVVLATIETAEVAR